MPKLKNRQELSFYRKYHLPGGSTLNSVRLNVIYLNSHNDLLHEKAKFDICWEFLKQCKNYITEASRKATDEEIVILNLKKKGKRQQQQKIVDVVDITSQQEYEIIYHHETDEQIKFYREHEIVPIIVGDFILCSCCGEKYPKRAKHNLCQNCKR